MTEKGPRVSRAARLAMAFAGGVLMAFGAALARGCTSGQALTGGALLNLGSWAFMMMVFAGGVRLGVLHEEAMAMIAPFFKFGMFGDEPSLVVAFLIGIGFGFFLERAGFGSARKLVSQFYLNDLAVFKVMFTAIVTAMLGVTYLAWMGWLDLSLVYLVPTYLVPQIVGGLILGVGLRRRRILSGHVGGGHGDGHALTGWSTCSASSPACSCSRSCTPGSKGFYLGRLGRGDDHPAGLRPARTASSCSPSC